MESTTEAMERFDCFGRESARVRAEWEDLGLIEGDPMLFNNRK
jgi:hypothetical protein